MLTTSKIIMNVALVLGIVVLLNFLADRFYFRLDFTADDRYTLSDATQNMLDDLDQPVTISAYFSEGLNPEFDRHRQDLKDILTEYDRRSGGMVVYEFINPNESEEKEQEAAQAGISPFLVNIREKDQLKQQKAFLGATVQLGDKKEIIPLLRPGDAFEYTLSSKIKKIAVTNKPVVGLLQGHGEPSINAIQQAASLLTTLNDLEPLTITDTTEISDNIKTVAILAPSQTIPPQHLAKLDNFMARGGRIYIGINRVSADLSQGQGNEVATGLETWLAGKGITIQPQYVIDANCGNVMVQQRQGPFSFQTPVKFPYLPNITNFADHPITNGLEAVLLQFASPVSVSMQDTSVKVTVLAKTSETSGYEPTPVFFDVTKEWVKSDFTGGDIPVAVAVEGKLNGAETKMVVVGDGDFAVNGEGQRGQQQAPDNINFMVNAIDWLSDDTGLNELRTKSVSSRPIEDLEDSTRAWLKWLNFFVPILLVILYGIIRGQIRNAKQRRWRNESYA